MSLHCLYVRASLFIVCDGSTFLPGCPIVWCLLSHHWTRCTCMIHSSPPPLLSCPTCTTPTLPTLHGEDTRMSALQCPAGMTLSLCLLPGARMERLLLSPHRTAIVHLSCLSQGSWGNPTSLIQEVTRKLQRCAQRRKCCQTVPRPHSWPRGRGHCHPL